MQRCYVLTCQYCHLLGGASVLGSFTKVGGVSNIVSSTIFVYTLVLLLPISWFYPRDSIYSWFSLTVKIDSRGAWALAVVELRLHAPDARCPPSALLVAGTRSAAVGS